MSSGDAQEPGEAWERIRKLVMPEEAAAAALPSARLKAYWTTGEGAARIRWGTEGDLTRCHRLVTQEAGADAATFDVWGYCQNLHKGLFGRPNPSDEK
jgi:hypothetical protein